MEREGQLLPVAIIRIWLDQVAGILRRSAETLRHDYGAGALQIYLDALDEAEEATSRFFDEQHTGAAE
ncbi:MAG: hypothetical protein R3C12_24910 [Planctomycetaceae bacterium]